jgi:malonyl-CoA O-methyltransferase
MVIYREHLASYRKNAPELVLLHGWASDSSIWRPLLASLRRDFHITLIDLPGCGRSEGLASGRNPDEYINAILPFLPAQAIYCGWSLGGMLATRLAAQLPERVMALICLASNAVFVADPDWPAAMPMQDFDHFASLVSRKPHAGLRRFEFLQLHGDDRAQFVREQLEQIAITQNQDHLSVGLACLQVIDNRQALTELQCPCLYLFGEDDALVPSTAAALLRQRYPKHHVQIIPERGHLFFLADQGFFSTLLQSYCCDLKLLTSDAPMQLNKADIGRSFSRAAGS